MSAYSKNFAKKLKPFLEERTFTVSEFVDFVNGLLEPLKICKVTVKGEIGEDIYKNKKRGWMIINLVDEEGSQLNCFAPSYVIDRMGVSPEPGMEIKITGYPKVLKNKGRFSFQITRVGLVGEGDLKKQFEILKNKLEEAGYFDPQKKQKIPDFAQKIGLITSKGSDAEKDFFTHLDNYGFEVKTYNSRVEGDSALDDLLTGIKVLNREFPELEAIVITRGGGSWESLKAFNSEELVKAAFSSKIPIISGVGHENDITLLDLVADKRVSTPTDAGKFLSKAWKDGEKYIKESQKNISVATKRIIRDTERRFYDYKNNIERKVKAKIKEKERNLNYLLTGITDKLKNRIEKFYSLEKELRSQKYKIKTKINIEKKELSGLTTDLETNKERWQKSLNEKVKAEKSKLFLSSPVLKLKQGYSITKVKNKLIKSSKQVKKGDLIETRLSQGVIKSIVEDKNNNQ